MPSGDFDTQYAEVADEPRTSIGPLFEFGGTFDEKLADLCQDIVVEYDKSRLTYAPEGITGESPGDTLEDPAQGGPFSKQSYAAEIRQLALEEFPVFFEAANIDRFAEISSSLKAAADSIVAAKGDTALGHLQGLADRLGRADRRQLRDVSRPPRDDGGVQLAFVGDVGAASVHFETLMKRLRVDAYGLATNLMAKVDPPSAGGATTVTNALLVMGLIAAGVATFGTGALVGVAGVVAVSEFAIAGTAGVVQIQQGLQMDEEGDRE